MRGKKKIPIPLPNTGVLKRRKQSMCIRCSVIAVIIVFAILQFNIISWGNKVEEEEEEDVEAKQTDEEMVYIGVSSVFSSMMCSRQSIRKIPSTM